jgi:hypothetical protein
MRAANVLMFLFVSFFVLGQQQPPSGKQSREAHFYMQSPDDDIHPIPFENSVRDTERASTSQESGDKMSPPLPAGCRRYGVDKK